MRTICLISLLLLSMWSCKKPVVEPDCGSAHQVTIVAEAHEGDTLSFMKSVNLSYGNGCGAFNYNKKWSLAIGSEKLTHWDTTFTGYSKGEVNLDIEKNKDGFRVYYVVDGDTSFPANVKYNTYSLSFKIE